jgi:hypothetical protein
MGVRPGTVPRLARLLDAAVVVGLAAAIGIYVTGGLDTVVGGIRLRARSPDRTLLVAVALLGLRLLIDRRTPAPDWLRAGWQRVRRLTPVDEPRPAPDLTSSATTRKHHVLAALGIMAFGAVMLRAQLAQMEGVPELGDPVFSIWRIGWVVHHFGGDPRDLFDANIFYPAKFALAFSDSILLPSLLTAPLLLAGLPPAVAVNTMLVASFGLSAFACYSLCRSLTGSATAGFIGGLIFGFYPYRYDHYTHFELLMTYWIPVAILMMHRFIDTARVRYAVAAAVFTAAQLYSSMYLTVYFLWFAAVLALVLLVRAPRPLPSYVRGGLAGAAVLVVLALPLARAYTAAHLNERLPSEVLAYSAQLSDYLRAHPRSAFWSGRMLGYQTPEHALFPGLVAIVLAIVALGPPWSRTRVAYAAALLFAVEFSRGFYGTIYPVLYKSFTFMHGMRAPARAGMLVGLALAVLASFAVKRIAAGRTPRQVAMLTTALTFLLAVDLQPVLHLERVWPSPPGIYTSLDGRPDAVLAEFPMGLSPGAAMTDMPHMYFSLWHWRPLVNGYSGHAPDGYGEFLVGMKSFPDTASIGLLRGRGVTHVTINCALYTEGCNALIARAAETPDLTLISQVTWTGQPVALYELRR